MEHGQKWPLGTIGWESFFPNRPRWDHRFGKKISTATTFQFTTSGALIKGTDGARPKVRYKIILKNFLSGGFYEIVFLRLETFLFAKSSLFGPLGELPQRPELFGPLGGSAPGQSAVRSPTSAATTVTIELRPSATELPFATVVYPRQVKILPPWEQLLKAQ